MATRQYAFVPPDTAQAKAPLTSRAQSSGLKYFQRSNHGDESDPGPDIAPAATGKWLSREDTIQQQPITGHPPLSKFRPVLPSGKSNVPASRAPTMQRAMGPPPTPRRPGVAGSSTQRGASIQAPGNRRFVPAPTNAVQKQQGPAGQHVRQLGGSGQRMPFVPGNPR